jgi:hypothetical protein
LAFTLFLTKIISMQLAKTLFSLILAFQLNAQNNFNFYLEPVNISNLGGIQSFSHGEYQGKWIIMGGRLDGLHQRQPFAAFSNVGHNDQIIVVDINAETSQSYPTASLPGPLYDQLRSTNMQSYQQDSLLILVGGYGYASAQADHITHPYVTIVNLKGLLNALSTGASITPHFSQILDQDMAVTGGYLEKLYNSYYIVGGQRFDGRYNPHNGPSFTQSYTSAVRRFELVNNNGAFSINWQNAYNDTALFHRRDYNVLPQIGLNGEEAMIAFSGVFQQNVDLPYLNAVYVDSSSYNEIPNFSQYYNHYHCASIAMYDSSAQAMHNVFFGGIAQYYDLNGVLTQDNNVPFVNTIARVSRDAQGNYSEHKLAAEMPSLLGAGSEFFIAENTPKTASDIIKFDQLSGDTILIGYILGGIESSAPNIFNSNTGTQSSASGKLFKVYLLKNTSIGQSELNPQSIENWQLQVSPNPSSNYLRLQFYSEKATSYTLSLRDTQGRLILNEEITASPTSGLRNEELAVSELAAGQYYVLLQNEKGNKVQQKVIIR